MKEKIMKFCAPVAGIYKGFSSMLSETGKQSIKRGISLFFSVALLYMVWFFLNKTVPPENQATFRHCFDVLCIMITLLTGAATVKDIIALKNGTKETTIVNTPAASVAQVIETPTNANPT